MIGRALRMWRMEQGNSSRAAASVFRFMAVAASGAWLFVFSSPLRMALASPWSGRHGCAIVPSNDGDAVPALPDAGQRGMIRQGCMQGVADEPADREIDLGLPHQVPIMERAKVRH